MPVPIEAIIDLEEPVQNRTYDTVLATKFFLNDLLEHPEQVFQQKQRIKDILYMCQNCGVKPQRILKGSTK